MPARCFRSPLLLFLIISLMSSCSFDFGNVPEGAQITCKTSADCPTGWVCSDTVLICVKPEDMKNRPQLVGSPVPLPALLKKDAVSKLSLEVNKELAEAPMVVVDVGGVKKTFLQDKLQSSGLKYVYTYTAAGDETQNAPWSVTVDLKDKVGNVASGLPAGSLTFDFVAPKIESAQLVGSPVKNGGVVRAVLTLDKAVEKDPVLKLDNSKVFVKESSSGGVNFTYSYEAAGDDGVEGGQTDRVVTITASDEAGNETISTITDKVTFDYQKPELIGDVTITPMYVAELGAVTVLFESNKDLGPDPEVKLGGVSMSLSVKDGKKYTYTHIAETADGEGLKPLSIKLVDKAGNETTTDTKKNVGFMFTKPVVSNVAANSAKFSKQSGFKDLSVTFDCPKDVGTGLVATIGNEPMTCLVWQPTSPNYTCTFDVSQTAQTGGYKVISITTLDLAGNNGEGSVGVEFDFAVPVLTLSISPEGRDARLGEKLTVSVASSKALVSPGVVLGTAGLDLGTPGIEGNIYTWVKEIKSGETGKYAITADGKDDVGNPAVQKSGSCGLDGVVPEIKDGVLNPPRIKGGGTLTAAFKVNKTVKPNPSVTASNSKDTPVTLDFDTYDPDQKLYTYKKAMPDSGTSPFYSVTVYAEDAAGNQVTSTLGTVEVDNTPPELAGFDLSPAEAKLGTIVRVIVTGSEIIEGAPILKAVKDGDPTKELVFSTTDLKGLSFSYQAEIKANTSDGTYRFQPFELKDAAGNKETRNPADKFKADFRVEASQPTVSNITLNKTRFSKQDGFKDIILNFDCPKDVGTGLDVKIGGDKVTCDPWKNTSPNYSCTYDVSKTALAEGSQIISIVAQDAVGNTSSGSRTVEFDFTAPELTLSIIPSERPAKQGEELKITVSSNKKLGGTGVVLGTGGLTMDSKSVSGNTYSWTRGTLATDQGNFTITADGSDEVGNPATQQTGTAKVDGVVPVITSALTLNKSPAYYKKDEKVEVTFTTNKNMDASLPTTVVNSSPTRSMTCLKTGTNTYKCTQDTAFAGTETPEGSLVTVVVSLQDLAGNTGFGQTTVTMDFTKPTVESNSVAPDNAGIGKTVVYTIKSDEALSADPVLHPTPTISFDGPSKAGNIYTWTHAVSALEATTDYTMKVDLVDLAGNQNSLLTVAPFKVTTDIPTTSGESVVIYEQGTTTTKVQGREGDTVRAYFTVGQELDTGSTVVKLGLVNMDFELMSHDSGGYHYTYKKAAASSMGNGSKDVVVSAINLAGNSYGKNIGQATLNFHAPDISGDATIVLFKPADCPLRQEYVTKATGGTEVRVSFAVTENLAGSRPDVVELRHTNGSGTVIGSFVLGFFSMSGLYYTYSAPIPAGTEQPEGAYMLYTKLTDLAGNAKEISGKTIGPPGFELKTTLPASPNVVDADKIIYHRMPWGTKDNNWVKKFTVRADGEVLSEDVIQVWFYDGKDIAMAAQTGYATAVNKSFIETELTRSDRPEVYISAYDAACNHSDAVKVRNIEWTANMGGKQPGSTVENPHIYEQRKVFAPYLAAYSEATTIETSGPSENNLNGQGRWINRTYYQTPPGRNYHAMAYDSARGRIVMFGGTGVGNETWEWDGSTWIKIPSIGPEAHWGHSMSYDSARGNVVMFGGGSDGQDTWVWDGQNWTMTHYAKPPVRGYFAMVFDAKRGKTVLFGGHDNLKFCSGGASTNCQDTWEWDGGSWQLASMAGPSARYYHAMAYDCARKKAVLFGGRDDDKICSNGVSIRCQDTWEWDGSNWQLVSTTGPSARYGHAMAYDSARGKVVMFGGNGVTNDTWEWDGSSWQLASTTGPSARSYHAMAYDSARGNILLFGGSSGSDETWEWDGNKWQQVMDASPSERRMHAMAYDSGRGKAVLFGGRDISKQCSGGVSEQCSDIWEWDGVNWQNIPATGPASRYSHAMAFNGTNGNVVMYGGHDSSKQCSDNVSEECPDTWEWNGISWQQKFISGPPARKAHAMAYDSDLNKIVLFSGADSSTACSGGTGQYCPDTWLYDGNAWQLFSNEGPTAREYHSMAYDSGRHKVVLFGGLIDGSHKGDTWEWDGASWEMIQSSAGLGVNSSSTLIYDAARRKILQFGGYYAGNETWEWNGINWKNVSLDGPSSRMRHAMVYDSIRERGVLFGGSSGGDETWEWTANNEKPAQVMQIVLYGSNIPLDRIKNVSAIFNSGGTGYSGTDCSAVHGTKLFTWNTAVNAGSWVEVANNTSSSGSPTNLSFSTTDMNLIKQLIIGRNSNTINLAIVPFSVNGCAAQMAAVKTNSAEVLIKYYLSD